MGEWSVPDTPEKKKVLMAKIKEIEQIKNDLYKVFGGDKLFDHFDLAITLMKEALVTEYETVPGLINMVPVKKTPEDAN